MDSIQKELVLSEDQGKALKWFLRARRDDIKLGMEDFGALEALLPLIDR